MINWYPVFYAVFWILGLALLLAAVSYHHWEARQTGIRLREQLGSSRFLKSFWASMLLVNVGLAGTSTRPWETAIWGILGLISLLNFARLLIPHRQR